MIYFKCEIYDIKGTVRPKLKILSLLTLTYKSIWLFFLFCRTQKEIFWRKLVAKQFWCPLTFSVLTKTLRHFSKYLFYVPQKKKSYTGLKWYEGEKNNTILFFHFWVNNLFWGLFCWLAVLNTWLTKIVPTENILFLCRFIVWRDLSFFAIQTGRCSMLLKAKFRTWRFVMCSRPSIFLQINEI